MKVTLEMDERTAPLVAVACMNLADDGDAPADVPVLLNAVVDAILEQMQPAK